MLNAKPPVGKPVLIRSLAAIAASAVLAGCAMHEGGRGMQMDTMHESGMHQMMQDMGCAHSPSEMQAMKKMTPEEKHAHMKAHMQECKSKLRQQAVDEAMTRIDACVEGRMSSHSHKRAGPKKMQAMIIAEIRNCASQRQPAESAPTKSDTHDGH